MARTTSAAVQALLGDDYDTVNSPDLTPRIDAATAIVSRVSTCATNKGITLSSTELELIERWVAAWLYTKTDRLYTNRSTADASGGFILGKDEPEPYKDGALALDYSGCLAAILNRNRAGAFWNGLPLSEQSTYDERNG